MTRTEGISSNYDQESMMYLQNMKDMEFNRSSRERGSDEVLPMFGTFTASEAKESVRYSVNSEVWQNIEEF